VITAVHLARLLLEPPPAPWYQCVFMTGLLIAQIPPPFILEMRSVVLQIDMETYRVLTSCSLLLLLLLALGSTAAPGRPQWTSHISFVTEPFVEHLCWGSVCSQRPG